MPFIVNDIVTFIWDFTKNLLSKVIFNWLIVNWFIFVPILVRLLTI